MIKSLPLEPSLLVDLAGPINALFEAGKVKAAKATRAARQAVICAMECGRLLHLQREALPHGAWQPWLVANCPDISFSTARRYMRLSRRVGHAGLASAAGLRQAYLVTGVLPSVSNRKRTPGAECPTISFVRGLDMFRQWFHRRTAELPLERWTPQARRLLRNDLVWFKRLHDRLGGDEPKPRVA
jgi:hypothetical protein